LLAVAGAPIMLGIAARELSVRLDGDFLRVSAPDLNFLDPKRLQLLKDGKTVGYLGQLTVLTGDQRLVSIAHFAISHDVWEEMNAGFRVTLVTPGLKTKPSVGNLGPSAAQAWCLDQLKIDLARLPNDRSVTIHLEIRSEDPKETDIIGEPGISLNGLIAVFSHPVKTPQIHVVREISLNIGELRRPRT
jgi:hypothetical protein